MIQPKYKIIYKQDLVRKTDWAVIKYLSEEEIQIIETLRETFGIEEVLYSGSHQQCLNWINRW